MTDEEIEERYYCENYRCNDCKYFKYVLRSDPSTGCHHRIDHHKICYGGSICISPPEELSFQCQDFKPSSIHVHGQSIWRGYDDWLSRWIVYWNGGKPLKRFMRFWVDGDHDMDYYAETSDWINGTIFDESGNPKWVYRTYLKRTRDGCGHKRVYERPENGQWILCDRETLFFG